jgi:acyl-CoA synthetase (AMP-forming)/AMP-acid ligase II
MADFIADADGAKWEDPSDPFGNLDEIVGIFPTGGTTGPSKGVNVTNLGWGTMIETVGNAIGGRTDAPVNLVVAPLTHAAGPVGLATLQFGATQVILPGFDPQAVFEAIEAHRITHMYLPPTALYGLLNHPGRDRFDVSSLKIFVLVGSAVAPEKLRQAVEVFALDPAKLMHVDGLWLTARDAAIVQMQLHRVVLVGVGYAADLCARLDLNADAVLQLTLEGFQVRLADFDLAAWKLPEQRQHGRRAALRHEVAIVFGDHRRHDANRLGHGGKPLLFQDRLSRIRRRCGTVAGPSRGCRCQLRHVPRAGE